MRSFPQWLTYIATIHSSKIDLSLTRIKTVAEKLQVLNHNSTVIIVAGTNGKGSCVALLQQTYLEAGYTVASFTSPYLLDFNEQIKLAGNNVDDETLCNAFTKIEQARGPITLTTFEFTTLAALLIFKQAQPEVIILEVGLGGKDDATNIVNSDLAIITNIELEHCNWLGTTRAKIALHKAGIMRPNCPTIYGATTPPTSLLNEAKRIGSTLYCKGDAYDYILPTNESLAPSSFPRSRESSELTCNIPFTSEFLAPSSSPRTRGSREWLEEFPLDSLDSRVRGNDGSQLASTKCQELIRERYKDKAETSHILWNSNNGIKLTVPTSNFHPDNSAAVLMTLTLLQQTLPVSNNSIAKAFRETTLIGRFQTIEQPITQIVDVAHNPASIEYLAKQLATTNHDGKTFAVLSMLNDKDHLKSVTAIKDQIDFWHIAPLAIERAATIEALEHALITAGITNYQKFTSLTDARDSALGKATKADRIITFGSFYVVSVALSTPYS